MADTLSPEKRSWNMSRVHNTDTSIEVKVRKYLFSKEFRFRKNDKRYPGKPDVVLPKYKTVIFVYGFFWHGHDCRNTHPADNADYWIPKIQRNVEWDIENTRRLKEQGWQVLTVWECQLQAETAEKTLLDFMERIEANIAKSSNCYIE